MKYSFLLSPARQPTPRLELRHGHINHPTQPWDESKLEINVLQGLTAAQRGMLERGCGNGGSQCRDTLPMLLTRQGKGLQPQAQCVGTGIRPRPATLRCSRNPGCREGSEAAAPQRVVWGEGTGPPCPARASSERGESPQSCGRERVPVGPAERSYRCLAR